MEINFIVLFLVFYLIGSIPFAYILTKFFGLGDIRNIGSGNVGATNVLRTGNRILALIVLFLDILKGSIPLIILKNYFLQSSSELVIYTLGSFVILGHLFPIWLKFRGGKGVATYIGYIFSVDYVFGLIYIFLWLIIAFISKFSSLASIISLIILPFVMCLKLTNINVILLFFLISIIIISKHYSNILRLFNKSESKIKL